jgi:DNA-binding NarL/FixJ family response regulator
MLSGLSYHCELPVIMLVELLLDREPWVLLIEDDVNDEELGLRALRMTSGAPHVRVASDGEAALELLRSATSIPCLIISDLKLPKRNGKELLSAIRDQAHFACVPIVIFSSACEAEEVDECYRLGANGFEQKPMDFDLYISTVRSIFTKWVCLNPCMTAA